MSLTGGEYHDASRCTIDGRAWWIAVLMDGDRMFNAGTPAVYESVSGHNTRDEAIAWLRARLPAGFPIRDTTKKGVL